MKIEYTHKFKIRVGIVVDFISNDSPARAEKFYYNLKKRIQKITYMPYGYRKSKTQDNEQIRDLIFKGYVIPFLIDQENDTIEILSIYGRNLP